MMGAGMKYRKPAKEPRARPRPKGAAYDHGIRKTVELLQQNGIETYESCEGGRGHAYHEPTVDFRGGPEAGFRCLAVCMMLRLPVAQIRRVWEIQQGEPVGPIWSVVFKWRPG
jgi:hypothetical protein